MKVVYIAGFWQDNKDRLKVWANGLGTRGFL